MTSRQAMTFESRTYRARQETVTANRQGAYAEPARPAERRPQEVSCVRCQAVIVVTERIANAEMHCILGHLRGCVREVFRGHDGPAFDEVFRLIRVKK
jgi:hypothetical protein